MKKTLLILIALLAASADSAAADTIELHNGRVIHGKVISELPSTGPVRITFTGGGSLTLDPGRIRRILRDSSCDFKTTRGKSGTGNPRKEETDAGKNPGSRPPAPEEKKKPAKEPVKPGEGGGKPIEAKLEAEILRHISELSRQRSQNRVRAEAALKRLGPATLPYLEKAANHPFALGRRAVIRIVAEFGGSEGIELLRAALNDKDPWVKKLAREALDKSRR